ncbi:ATP-binding response regulator [Pseudoxanthomonas suwonensis]|uniref:histidine kinase n=1 Tax=Pseudoxanthomonas suwonensis TaxID=314722 RepID=A0A0E3Z087_9GAMM|nr:hybrid sensor histidine kinase/response regulator [Pseudoxanthomonas suwonensis]AKC85918.1 hypothetical protein WQ53_03225 [Pseudoxanthomonas suwonensis]
MRRGDTRGGLVRTLARLALLPAIVVGLSLAAVMHGMQYRELQRIGEDGDLALAGQAAVAVATMLERGDHDRLRLRMAGMSQRHGLARIVVMDADGAVLADSGIGAGSAYQTQAEIAGVDGRRIGTLRIENERRPIAAAQRSSLFTSVALLLLLFSVATAIAWRAAGRIGRPIIELAGAIAPRGSGRVLRPVAVTGKDEVRQLQEGFNATVAALQDSSRYMQRQIERATLELERKNAALETANQARARFLAAASHDLRQPLSALTLFSSALTLGEKDPVRLSRINHIQECVDSLDHLFNSLLDLSRLEAGAMQPAIGEFALDGLFDEVSRTFRMGAEQRGLRLIVRKTDAWVRCDRVMLSRILNNLVCNAIRYTAEGGVLIAARCRAGRIRIDVWDTGPGIPPEQHQRVFEEFFQGHSHAPVPPGERRGLGLGLATVQRLCALLDVPIALKSRLGRGTLFAIEVPAAARVACHEGDPTPEPPLDVTGLRVLAIDDEPAILEGLRILMESWGCIVATAADGVEAMRVARSWPIPPDIVVSDLQLGGGRSGLDVIRALQGHYRGKGFGDFARLLITGETKHERLREISAARIPVLYKPVTPEQLREAMMATIAVRQVAA